MARAQWARATLRHLEGYQPHHPLPTVSGLTVFELLEGLYREGRTGAAQDFRAHIPSDYHVIYPDEAITALGAEIHAALARGQTIGVADTLIAATAITGGLILVTANTDHFARVQVSGFALELENWREA